MKSNDLLSNYKFLKNQLSKLQEEVYDKHNLIRNATVFETSVLVNILGKLFQEIGLKRNVSILIYENDHASLEYEVFKDNYFEYAIPYVYYIPLVSVTSDSGVLRYQIGNTNSNNRKTFITFNFLQEYLEETFDYQEEAKSICEKLNVFHKDDNYSVKIIRSHQDFSEFTPIVKDLIIYLCDYQIRNCENLGAYDLTLRASDKNDELMLKALDEFIREYKSKQKVLEPNKEK